MRYLLTFLLCVLTLSLSAQETCPNVFDYDNDGNVAVNDFLAMLGYFGDTDSDSDGVWDSEDDCIDEVACNYQSNPTEPCDDLDMIGVCGGNCMADVDGDGICDLIPITNDNVHAAVDLWLASIPQAVATYGHISEWDVSSVTNMYQLFYSASTFNGDISSWDVSSVTDMTEIFAWSSFNGDISSWDVSSLTEMRYMFYFAESFNSDLSSWDVSNVTSMNHVFYGASSFNGDISSWDVSSVTGMHTMFRNAYSFNSDLSSWDVSSVTDMYGMFYYAESFNSDLSSWDVSSVTRMNNMFLRCLSFNSDLSSWNVSNVSDFSGMFDNTSALSEENKCAIHTSFSLNTNWPYDWYGNCPFVCGDLVSHQGYDYSTVLIGEQCWYSENCRYLPSVSPADFSSDTTPYYYVYSYDGYDVEAAKATENYDTYGVLYNWPAVMTEGICQSGWHIPSDEEFTQLTDYLGGMDVAGGKMKEAGYDHWNSPNTGATNSSGWTGLPGGDRYSGGFGSYEVIGDWWSASESGSYSWLRRLDVSSDDVLRGDYARYYGFSARCVRD